MISDHLTTGLLNRSPENHHQSTTVACRRCQSGLHPSPSTSSSRRHGRSGCRISQVGDWSSLPYAMPPWICRHPVRVPMQANGMKRLCMQLCEGDAPAGPRLHLAATSRLRWHHQVNDLITSISAENFLTMWLTKMILFFS